MKIVLSAEHLHAIEAHGESTYPNEGAGFLLGRQAGDAVHIEALLPLENKREMEAQYNRYELGAQDFVRAELEAAQNDLDLVGVFHSHPDHPARPSEFDRDHALPHFSYLITAVAHGQAETTNAWRLCEDRSRFDHEPIEITQSMVSQNKEET